MSAALSRAFTGKRFAALGVAALVASVLTVVSQAAPAHAATFAGYQMAFQDPDSRLWTVAPNGAAVRTLSALQQETSPDIAGVVGGGFAMAFTASDSTVWMVDSLGGRQLKTIAGGAPLRVRSSGGPSPSIAASPGGGWQLAYPRNAVTGFIDSLTQQETTLSFNDPGNHVRVDSNPSVAMLQQSAHVSTWVGATDNLVRVKVTGVSAKLAGNGLGAAPGTSPAIAANGNGGWKLAFQGGDTRLWTVDSTNRQVQTLSALAPKTSPDIAADGRGGFEMAFVGSDGFLWHEAPDGTGRRVGAGLSVAPGTSPRIATDGSGGWKIAFHALGGRLFTADSAGRVVDTGLLVRANTNPAIAALETPPAPPPAPTPTPAPTQPSVVTKLVTLVKQDAPFGGFVPYTTKFPEFGATQPGRLKSISLFDAPGLFNKTVFFVKAGRTTAQCGDPTATVAITEGQKTTPAQIAEIYTVSEPRFTTLSPLGFVACVNSGTNTILSSVQIQLEVVFD